MIKTEESAINALHGFLDQVDYNGERVVDKCTELEEGRGFQIDMTLPSGTFVIYQDGQVDDVDYVVTREKKMNLTMDGYLQYAQAEKLVRRMESEEIMASIKPGGIGVYPTENKYRRALEIAAEFGVTLFNGYTMEEMRVLEPDAFKIIMQGHGVKVD